MKGYGEDVRDAARRRITIDIENSVIIRLQASNTLITNTT